MKINPNVSIYHWKALLKGISIQLLKLYFVKGTVHNLQKHPSVPIVETYYNCIQLLQSQSNWL